VSLDSVPTDASILESFISDSRKHIEPWLSAAFQAEHLHLLLGSGFTTAIGFLAGAGATGMTKVKFGTTYDAAIDLHAEAGAKTMRRGSANIEDQFRSALSVLAGLEIIDTRKAAALKTALDTQMSAFLSSLLKTESDNREGKRRVFPWKS